ncbi:MAG: hypothetical protein V7727_18160 [Sneathiella sp.]
MSDQDPTKDSVLNAISIPPDQHRTAPQFSNCFAQGILSNVDTSSHPKYPCAQTEFEENLKKYAEILDLSFKPSNIEKHHLWICWQLLLAFTDAENMEKNRKMNGGRK